MELFRNIFLNTDKVVENTDIKVTYAGKLFQNGAQNVVIHYGYGAQWDNAQDVQMEKTELGYQATIYVESAETLNFCFKNEYGEWDNNDGNNFTFEIEKADCAEVNNVDCHTNAAEENAKAVEEKSLCKVGPTWAELIKKTFSNIINYITKIFSGKKENVNDNNK